VTKLSATEKGYVGELFTVFFLNLHGYSAMIVPNRRPYDVAMEHADRLIKIQVKTSTYKNHQKKGYNSGYTYSINRRSRITKNNKVFHYYENYNDYDCDIFAFVQPRLYKIAFFHTEQLDIKFRKILHPHQFEEYPIEKALEYMDIKKGAEAP
tara:strand:+ start:186 stop:644 length:459 start_codon:yes stop_codon:yes gene_type:complete